MMEKHPRTSKGNLAKMYFLRTKENKVNVQTVNPTDAIQADEFLKYKNRTWVFHGLSKDKTRFGDSRRIFFLQNPTNVSNIISARKYMLPKALRDIHAFHEKFHLVEENRLAVALLATDKLPTLKDKLFNKQKGKCMLCDKEIELDLLHTEYTHVHHIKPISKGGNKYVIKNLGLTHN